MKKNAILGALFILVLSFFITGCKEKEVSYDYRYEVLINDQVINDQVFSKSGSTDDYVVYLNQTQFTTDLKLTFNIYEKPLRDHKFNPTELLKNSFNVSTIYNDFTNNIASNTQVEIDNEKYNKYSINYSFDDIKKDDVITIKLNDDVVKKLELVDNKFDIRFETN